MSEVHTPADVESEPATSSRPGEQQPGSGSPGRTILAIHGLRRHFGKAASRFIPWAADRPVIRALDGVSFDVVAGENFGLVGESGSGKTTLAKLILQLDEPTDGTIEFDGHDVGTMSTAERKRFRSRTHIVFQDPNGSLSPRMLVRDIVAEPIDPAVREPERSRRVAEAIDRVGLPANAADRYPHEFSGGQRQRIAIARAIANEPDFLVLDEPVSALDVSIRAQILNLLEDLKQDLGLTYLTIAHDLAVVYQACDRTGVMYLGRMVELGPSESLFKRPLHPYTRLLIDAIPIPNPDIRMSADELVGEIPSPSNPPSGCTFHTRCPIAMDTCRVDVPEWRQIEPGRWVACHAVDAESGGIAPQDGVDESEPVRIRTPRPKA